jgi:hypothetical protein
MELNLRRKAVDEIRMEELLAKYCALPLRDELEKFDDVVKSQELEKRYTLESELKKAVQNMRT